MKYTYEIWWVYEHKPTLKGVKKFIRTQFKKWQKTKFYDINLPIFKKFIENKYPDICISWIKDKKTIEIYVLNKR